MSESTADRVFAGSMPRVYDTLLVPLIFEAYAADLVSRVAARRPSRVLEVAAGTGVVTRRLADALPPETAIVATDLNQPMLDQASAKGTSRPVEWRQADAMNLPFPDASFDVVVCQFGVMFFPDKAKAIAEARRLLKPGGAYFFSVWDGLGVNVFADVVTSAVAALFPDDPPRFLARTPYAYFDRATIERDVAGGGFAAPAIETLTFQSEAPSARDVAVAYCQGTPLRNEIDARKTIGLAEATDAATHAVAKQFGDGPVAARMQAIVVTNVRI